MGYVLVGCGGCIERAEHFSCLVLGLELHGASTVGVALDYLA